MRTIPLKSDLIALPNGQEQGVTTEDLIRTALNNPPQGGFSMEDFRKRSRVDRALESSRGEELILEDQDYETLKDCVQNCRWSIRAKFIEQFINQFL